jgi:hypothetical protein
MESPSLEASSQ